MLKHVEALKKLPGASLAFGGDQLQGHSIPQQYGAITPTAVFVPLAEILKPENFELVTTEVFGPVQVLFRLLIAFDLYVLCMICLSIAPSIGGPKGS